jgi:hypothetical protein
LDFLFASKQIEVNLDPIRVIFALFVMFQAAFICFICLPSLENIRFNLLRNIGIIANNLTSLKQILAL